MLTAPTNWNTLWAQLGTDMEVRLSIGGKNYLNADIAAGSLKLTHALYDSYSTGNANAAKLSCTLFTTDTMPEGAAKAVLSVRLTNGATTTPWVSQGTYYLDTAELTESDTTKIVLYDGLALADRYLYTDGVVPESETYPQNALTTVNAICSLLNLSLDTSNKTAWQAVECSAPDGMSCRQILQSIAAAAGGNWTMSKAGKLLFVPLCDVSTQLKSGLEASASSFSVTSTKKRVMVASLHNGQETFTRGTGGYEVAATCAFASDANMTRAFNALQGKQYQGFKAQGVFISPLVELGDMVSVTGGQDMVADSYTLTYQQGCWGDMDSPLRDEVEKRIGAIDNQARQMRIAKYAALIDELDQAITSGEIFNSIIEQLNAKANETGGWFYYVEGQGVRTYDKAVSDPAVGTEATQCVEIRGGVIRIANSKDKNGNWIFRSVFESGHIASELVTAVQIASGYIGSSSGNFWNLDTGELRMAATNKFVDADGNEVTIVDINNLANDTAYIAQLAEQRITGGEQLLRGTNTATELKPSGSWEAAAWRSASGGTGTRTRTDISDAPANGVTRGWKLSGGSGLTDISQDGIPVTQGQNYTLSCYAKGGGKLRLQVGADPWLNMEFDTTTTWRRYALTFKAGDGNAAIKDGKTNIYFGKSSGTLEVCGLKLERGDTATDWSAHKYDVEAYTTTKAQEALEKAQDDANKKALQALSQAKAYTDAITEEDRSFTKNQVKALDSAMTQAEIFKRLTNNGKTKGIYIDKSELYINADYIKSGVIDAGIIKAGILASDAAWKYYASHGKSFGDNSFWNMSTGYMQTKNAVMVNASLDGSFRCGKQYKIEAKDGRITGYQDSGKTNVGFLEFSVNTKHTETGKVSKGLILSAGIFNIRTPYISVSTSRDLTKAATTTFTGKKKWKVVESLKDLGNGALQWQTVEHGIEVINGLIVSIW